MSQFIENEFNSGYFTAPPLIPISQSYQCASPAIPLLFILSPGDDPGDELTKFATERGKNIEQISLGKGQGALASKKIQDSIKIGAWVYLQNCHLAVSWLNELQQIVEDLKKELEGKDKAKINPEFRLWLTSFSIPEFPKNLLQDAVKMTKDPPKGIKANVEQIYKNQMAGKAEVAFFNSCTKQEEWQKLYMGLSYFHAIVRERKRYGAIGWNIHYDFNDSDLKISMRQLQHMLDNYSEIPYKALTYLTGECYYGGKVTDDWDRRLLKSLLNLFYNDVIFVENYQFSSVPEYYIPEEMNLENAIQFIQQLPDKETPELFGLNSNALITSSNTETNMIISSVLSLRSQSGSAAGVDKNVLIKQTALETQKLIPTPFNIPTIIQKYPLSYYESMNTVLLQELLRYNTLLSTITSSLNEVLQALEGLISMTWQLEAVTESLMNNQVPSMWKQKSYPTLKSLQGYIRDLVKRINMFEEWVEKGIPKVFWVSGFFFTHSFFTGTLQNYARKHTIPIDQLHFKFKVVDEKQETDITEPPVEGVYIMGLFLEGARWNSETHALDEAIPKVIYEKMPIVWLIPDKINAEKEKLLDNQYIYKFLYYPFKNFVFKSCPVYKTSERKGVLSTTGHSTNFILGMELISEKKESHWVLRGVALLTQLDD